MTYTHEVIIEYGNSARDCAMPARSYEAAVNVAEQYIYGEDVRCIRIFDERANHSVHFWSQE